MSAREQGAVAARFEQVAKAESELIAQRRRRRGLDPEGPRRALAFSGGGVASAAFGLGVARALHERGVFEDLDYLSAVGGGGCAGASTRWLRREGMAAPGSELADPGALRRLRARAEAWRRGEGGLGTARIAVAIGTVARSLGVHLARLMGLFFLLHVGDRVVDLLATVLLLETRGGPLRFAVLELDFGLVAGALVLALVALRSVGRGLARAAGRAVRAASPRAFLPSGGSLAWGALFFVVGAACTFLAATAVASGLSVANGLAALLFGSVAVASLRAWRARWTGRGPGRSRWRAFFSVFLGVAAALVVAALALYAVAWTVLSSGPSEPGVAPRPSLWAGVVVLGLTVAFWVAFVPRGLRDLKRFVSRFVRGGRARGGERERVLRFERRQGRSLVLAGSLFVLGSVPLALDVASFALGGRALALALLGVVLLGACLWAALSAPRVRFDSSWRRRAGAAVGAAILYGLLLETHGWTEALIDGRVPSAPLAIGLVGIVAGALWKPRRSFAFRFARERIAETFLPGAREFPLAALADETSGPYLLVNASVAPGASDRPEGGRRTAESFLLSPLFCGATATGWARTARFEGGRLTLPDALAISAADSLPADAPADRLGPDPGGDEAPGPLRRALALLGVSRGYRALPPDSTRGSRAMRFSPRGLASGTGSRAPSSVARRQLLLGDGSRFEHLGLYEPLRRGVDWILTFDVQSEPERRRRALERSLELAEEDFDVRVTFPEEAFASDEDGEATSLTRDGFAFAEIHYPDERPAGRLIYVEAPHSDESSFGAWERAGQLAVHRALDALTDIESGREGRRDSILRVKESAGATGEASTRATR